MNRNRAQMMINRRNNPQITKSIQPSHKNIVQSLDHWAFLDEIEAPMWADLNLEATSCYKDDDGSWFEISHPVHQCSSRKLKSSLSHAGEVKANIGSGLIESSSPQLPPSVSKSRGKDFKSRDWPHGNSGITTSKEHPIKNLKGKSSWTNSGSGKNLNPKPSDNNVKKTGRLKASSVCESSFTESSSNRTAYTRESKTTSNLSTITYEKSENQGLKFSETSGILSELRVTLRKSCVQRQALRVERDSVGGRQSRGRSSSSGKSSVGSSSHPGNDAGNGIGGPTLKSKDATPDSRNVNRMVFANLDKVVGLTTSKKLNAESLATKCRSNATPDSRNVNRMVFTNLDKVVGLTTSKKLNAESLATKCRSKTVATKSIPQEAAKPKIVNSKVMTVCKGNESLAAATSTKCKTETRRYIRVDNGKENAKNKTRIGAGEIIQVQKVKKPNAALKTENRGIIGPKVKICSRDEKKSLACVTKNIYFR